MSPLPTTPGSVVNTGSDGDPDLFWVLQDNGRWYGRNYITKDADDFDGETLLDGACVVVFDAGSDTLQELNRYYAMAVTTLGKRTKKAETFVAKVSRIQARVDEGSMNGWQYEKAIERLLNEWHDS